MVEKITTQVSDFGNVWILVDGENAMFLGRQSSLTNEVAARINHAEALAEACEAMVSLVPVPSSPATRPNWMQKQDAKAIAAVEKGRAALAAYRAENAVLHELRRYDV